ncbi:MAG: 50S ribosomal protein L24 [Kiritimatiellaeota bacterium]|jgi:large subunit ribosomal protein L24|nr:50S ribosomal protein L24 [Kiritimatiellota bacterium]
MSVKRIKKDDEVIVIAGKDNGKTGKVISVNEATQRALVDNINMRKKTIRKSQQFPEGKIMDVPAPIHLSNIMLYDPKTKKGARIRRVREDGKSVRVSVKTGHRFE